MIGQSDIFLIQYSVFYNRAQWHVLIDKYVTPFFDEEYTLNRIDFFFINLSLWRGDHIDIVFQPSVPDGSVNQRFCDSLELFLNNNPSQIREITYPLNSLFADYPTNCIMVNKAPNFNQSDFNNHLIRQDISNAMIEAIGSEIFSLETILSFTLYMLLGTIYSIYPTEEKLKKAFPQLFCWLNKPSNDLNSSAYDDTNENIKFVFENNLDTISEIIGDLWKSCRYSGELYWLETWIGNFSHYMIDKTEKKDFFSVIELIYLQVGITDKNTISELCKCLFECLFKYYDRK